MKLIKFTKGQLWKKNILKLWIKLVARKYGTIYGSDHYSYNGVWYFMLSNEIQIFDIKIFAKNN